MHIALPNQSATSRTAKIIPNCLEHIKAQRQTSSQYQAYSDDQHSPLGDLFTQPSHPTTHFSPLEFWQLCVGLPPSCTRYALVRACMRMSARWEENARLSIDARKRPQLSVPHMLKWRAAETAVVIVEALGIEGLCV